MIKEKSSEKYREFPQNPGAPDTEAPAQPTVLMSCGGAIVTINGPEPATTHHYTKSQSWLWALFFLLHILLVKE